MVVGEDVGPPPRGDDRHLQDLGEADEIGRRAGPQDAGAGQDERAPSGGETADRRAHEVRVGIGRAGPDDVGHLGACRHRLVEDVLGDRDERRPGPAAEGLTGGLGHRRGQAGRIVDLDRVRGEPADGPGQVRLLERLAAAHGAGHLAEDREHRGGIGPRRVDADGQVRGPDGPGRQGHRGPARQLAVRVGHERGAALVAGRDDTDAGRAEGVEEAEEALARDGEGHPHAGRVEGVGEEATGRPRRAHGERRGLGAAATTAGARPPPRARSPGARPAREARAPPGARAVRPAQRPGRSVGERDVVPGEQGLGRRLDRRGLQGGGIAAESVTAVSGSSGTGGARTRRAPAAGR